MNVTKNFNTERKEDKLLQHSAIKPTLNNARLGTPFFMQILKQKT